VIGIKINFKPFYTHTTVRVSVATAFQVSLSAFLQSLGVDVETLLHRVDFLQLSPAVNLICTVPSQCSARC